MSPLEFVAVSMLTESNTYSVAAVCVFVKVVALSLFRLSINGIVKFQSYNNKTSSIFVGFTGFTNFNTSF